MKLIYLDKILVIMHNYCYIEGKLYITKYKLYNLFRRQVMYITNILEVMYITNILEVI